MFLRLRSVLHEVDQYAEDGTSAEGLQAELVQLRERSERNEEERTASLERAEEEYARTRETIIANHARISDRIAARVHSVKRKLRFRQKRALVEEARQMRRRLEALDASSEEERSSPSPQVIQPVGAGGPDQVDHQDQMDQDPADQDQVARQVEPPGDRSPTPDARLLEDDP